MNRLERIREFFSKKKQKEQKEKKERLEKFNKALKGEFGREALIAAHAIKSLAEAGEELTKLNPPRYPSDFYQRKPRYLTYQERIRAGQRHIEDLIFAGGLKIDPETNQFLHGSAILEWVDLTPWQLPGLQPRPGRPHGKQRIRVDVQSRPESDNPLVLIEDNKRKSPVEIPVSEEDALEKVIGYLEEWVIEAMDRHFNKIEAKERMEYYSSGAWRIFGPY